MSDYNEPTTDGEVADVNPEGEPREDNRNEEVDESPIPDPTVKQTGAGDDPEAD